MTARIAGFLSRADLDLARPKSISRRITPGQGGTAVHYGGNPVRKRNHQDCIDTWRAWQAFHMRAKSLGGRGWTDIAYTGGFCDHGYAMAGRGAGIRTGANGTNYGNDNFYAVTWIGGDGQTPTQAAIDALEWWINELRRAGGAAARVVPHRFFKSTGCPGGPLVVHANRLDRAKIHTPDTPTPEEDDDMFAHAELIKWHYRRSRGAAYDPSTDPKDPGGWSGWMMQLSQCKTIEERNAVVASCGEGIDREIAARR